MVALLLVPCSPVLPVAFGHMQPPSEEEDPSDRCVVLKARQRSPSRVLHQVECLGVPGTQLSL